MPQPLPPPVSQPGPSAVGSGEAFKETEAANTVLSPAPFPPDSAAPQRPIPIFPSSTPPPPENQEKDRLLWRRKAAGRRLQRCAPDESGKEENTAPFPQYAPQFTPPRVQDLSPVFEQTEASLTGHVVALRGADARRREHSLMITGVILTALLGTSAASIMFRSVEERPASASASKELARAEAENTARVHDHSLKVPRATATLRAFFLAQTPEEKAPFIRGGTAMLPALRAYYSRHPDEPPGLQSPANTGFAEYEGREFFFMTGTSPAGAPLETLLESTPDGLKLDWRFLTGAGDLEWDEWIRTRPSQPVSMRAEASLDSYYDAPFADSREWLCLKMTDAAHTTTVWAYVPRSSEEGVTLHRQLSGRSGPVRLLGSFAFPDPLTTSARPAAQVHLRSLATRGWMDSSPEASTCHPATSP